MLLELLQRIQRLKAPRWYRRQAIRSIRQNRFGFGPALPRFSNAGMSRPQLGGSSQNDVPVPPPSALVGKPFILVAAIPGAGADFGPDTSGTNTSGVVEAMNAAFSSGSEVFLLPGTFTCSAQIVVPASAAGGKAINVRGSGESKTFLVQNYNDGVNPFIVYASNFAGLDQPIWENLTIQAAPALTACYALFAPWFNYGPTPGTNEQDARMIIRNVQCNGNNIAQYGFLIDNMDDAELYSGYSHLCTTASLRCRSPLGNGLKVYGGVFESVLYDSQVMMFFGSVFTNFTIVRGADGVATNAGNVVFQGVYFAGATTGPCIYMNGTLRCILNDFGGLWGVGGQSSNVGFIGGTYPTNLEAHFNGTRLGLGYGSTAPQSLFSAATGLAFFNGANVTGQTIAQLLGNTSAYGWIGTNSAQAAYYVNSVAVSSPTPLASSISLSVTGPTVLTAPSAYTAYGYGSTFTFTPKGTGIVMVIVNFLGYNNTAGDGMRYKLQYGTGTAPANGATTGIGSTAGQPMLSSIGFGAGDYSPFSMSAVLTGLTVNTAYWFDLVAEYVTGGNVGVANTQISIVELSQ